jgi:3-phenylpropionate/trans-cinnamate dioxygenase ferredoxin subunit
LGKERLCRLEEIPDGGLRLFRTKAGEILVFRRGDKVYGYDNKCPHLGFSLYLGTLSGSRLRCGYHGEVFDLETGEPEGKVVKKGLIKKALVLEMGDGEGRTVYLIGGGVD